MQFAELHTLIPHTLGEKLHVVEMSPYNGVTLAMPGRHQRDTPLPGGDFVVQASDTAVGWLNHPFTHNDIFNDVEQKHLADPEATKDFMAAYTQVVFGVDPDDFKFSRIAAWKKTVHPMIFLHAAQCLAVAEHRRYAKHEPRGGGRYLPLRFALGISEGLWTAKDCKENQRRGRPGLDLLMATKGRLPSLTGGTKPW